MVTTVGQDSFRWNVLL